MKNYIITGLLFISTFSFSQDFLGGDMQLSIDGSGVASIMTRVRIFTDANMEITRNSLIISRLTGDIIISKISDTLLTSNIRLSIYEGILGNTFDSNAHLYYDSLNINRIENIYDSSSSSVEYVEMYLFSAMSTGGSIFDPSPIGPICSDIMNAYYIENNILHYQIECPDTSPVFYSLLPLSDDDSLTYTVPSGFNLDSLTGKITWVNPPDSGLYMFRVYVQEGDILGNISENARIMFFDFDDPIPFTSSTKELVNNNYLQVFPNPTSDQLTVKFDYFTPDGTQLQIFDMTGQVVHQQQMTKQSHQVSMLDFTDGVYIVRVQSGDKIITRKVVKQ